MHVDLDVVGVTTHYLLVIFVICSRVSNEILRLSANRCTQLRFRKSISAVTYGRLSSFAASWLLLCFLLGLLSVRISFV